MGEATVGASDGAMVGLSDAATVGLSDGATVASREAPTVASRTCNRCGFPVASRAFGCKNPCPNCGTVYPLGDCSD